MNILLYDIGSFTQKDLIYYLEKAGHHCRNILYKQIDAYHDDFFEFKFRQILTSAPYDCVMSTNFAPIVAKLCHECRIKYLAWSYDSPINAEHIEYFQYDTNYLFLFDRIDAERIKSLGVPHVYHLPLAVNTQRLSSIKISAEDQHLYSTEISFVGKFYINSLPNILLLQNDYNKGYIQAILDSQAKIYGYYFVPDLVSDELISRIYTCLKAAGVVVTDLDQRSLIYNIAAQITCIERLTLLSILNQYHQVCYYSTEQPEQLASLEYRGTAAYHTIMPRIFRLSKLNLNPTLRNIQSGIPLRALDIMGSGGVLFSNFQPELAEYFIDGEDVIMYESLEDAVVKADYYLKHEELRQQIAQNGYQKVVQYFSYPDKIQYMFETAGLS